MCEAAPAPPLAAEDHGLRELLKHWPADTIASHLRFTLEDIRKLANKFFPATLLLPHHHGRVSGVDALVVLLLLHAPVPLFDLEALVGYADFDLSVISRTAASVLVHDWFCNMASPPWLTASRLQTYATAIHDKRQDGAATLVGFVDGTRRKISKPSNNALQRQFYNGWTHNHTLLWIAVVFADGTFLLRGPVGGRNNDLFILENSGLARDLRPMLQGFKVGGDGIFPIDTAIESMKLYLNGLCPPGLGDSRRFSAVRIVIEWVFDEIIDLFRYFRLSEAQVLTLTIPAIFYQAASILTNAHTCLYNSKVGLYFNLHPPKLEHVFAHHN